VKSFGEKEIRDLINHLEDDPNPLMMELAGILGYQQEQITLQRETIQNLRDEIARLKGMKPKPSIKPSQLEKDRNSKKKKRRKKKRPGSSKRSKTSQLTIHDTVILRPDNLPEGSRLLGYEDFTVQDITFCAHNTRYRKERWLTPEGKEIRGVLPAELSGKHYGSTLVCFVLYQYYHAHVTQPLILEQLREIGIDISSGKVNEIITENKDQFHEDKDGILKIGLENSNYIHVDDTGARHQGRNGYCTHIGNEYFAWFESTESKSRINFLKLLRGKATDFVLNEYAIQYMIHQKMPHFQLNKLRSNIGKIFADYEEWASFLVREDIQSKRHVQIATEGALLGSIIDHGISPDLFIMSDDAGQFDILRHLLCWIHAERTINKLLGIGTKQQNALDAIRTKIWDFYDDLKRYKNAPCQEAKAKLIKRFDAIFTSQTCYASLNLALERLYQHKAELLLVLDFPDIPLHNNLSERDIREYVKKRKISGSTRSNNGRRCRDTFISLKKTCRKLSISFWEYLIDRICGYNRIPPICQLIAEKAKA
jgi:hypothetical protein